MNQQELPDFINTQMRCSQRLVRNSLLLCHVHNMAWLNMLNDRFAKAIYLASQPSRKSACHSSLCKIFPQSQQTRSMEIVCVGDWLWGQSWSRSLLGQDACPTHFEGAYLSAKPILGNNLITLAWLSIPSGSVRLVDSFAPIRSATGSSETK